MSLELSESTMSREQDSLKGAITAARLVKRGVDVVGSWLLIICLSPVFLIVSAMVLFADGRPIIYRRRVVGTSGEFDAFKFRTMRRDADLMLETDPSLR